VTDLITLYGERPVTEFAVLQMTETEIRRLVESVRLANNTLFRLRDGSRFEKVYVEAPLGDPFGTVDLLFVFSSCALLCEVKPRPYVAREMQKQLSRYHRYLQGLGEPGPSRATPLVKEVRKIVSDRRPDTFLILVTDDPGPDMPEELRRDFEKLSRGNPGNLGWVGYSVLEAIVNQQGFIIERKARQVILRRTP